MDDSSEELTKRLQDVLRLAPSLETALLIKSLVLIAVIADRRKDERLWAVAMMELERLRNEL
jgi:hypothetical protein